MANVTVFRVHCAEGEWSISMWIEGGRVVRFSGAPPGASLTDDRLRVRWTTGNTTREVGFGSKAA